MKITNVFNPLFDRKLSIIGVLLLFLSPILILSQSKPSASFGGKITDSLGAAVPRATVRITGSGGEYNGTTSDIGEYHFKMVDGVYSMEIEPGYGFAAVRRGPFRIEAGRSYLLNLEVFPRYVVLNTYPNHKGTSFDDLPYSEIKIEDVPVSKSDLRIGKIFFGEKSVHGSKSVYTLRYLSSAPHKNRRQRVTFSYGLSSLVADTIEFDRRSQVITAKGNPSLNENGKIEEKTGSLKVVIRNEQFVILN
jgi:hypothetical protein